MIILAQESKGGGIGGSFLGATDASSSVFGTSTPVILKKITGYLGIIFILSCLLLSFWTASLDRRHGRVSSDDIIEESIK